MGLGLERNPTGLNALHTPTVSQSHCLIVTHLSYHIILAFNLSTCVLPVILLIQLFSQVASFSTFQEPLFVSFFKSLLQFSNMVLTDFYVV